MFEGRNPAVGSRCVGSLWGMVRGPRRRRRRNMMGWRWRCARGLTWPTGRCSRGDGRLMSLLVFAHLYSTLAIWVYKRMCHALVARGVDEEGRQWMVGDKIRSSIHSALTPTDNGGGAGTIEAILRSRHPRPAHHPLPLARLRRIVFLITVQVVSNLT